MPGPWDQYAAQPEAASGPWSQYAAPKPQTSVMDDIKQGGINVLAGGLRGAGSIGSTIMRVLPNALGGDNAQENEERRARLDENARNLLGAETDSWMYKGGKLGGEIAGTAGMGGVLAKPLQALAATRWASGIEPLIEGGVKALQSGGFRVGELAGTGLGTAMRVGAGATVGGASAGLVNPDDAKTGAMIGAALPAAVQLSGKIGSAIHRGVTGLVRPMTQKGQQEIAAEILQASATDARKAAQNLGNAKSLIPGSNPTVGQVAEDAGLAQLERTLYNNPVSQGPLANAYRDQGLARVDALRGIAGSDSAIASQEAAREAATKPVYDQAKNATYFVDDQLKSLLDRPLVQKAMSRAQAIAENEGRPFGFSTTSSTPFSGVGGGKAVTKSNITGNGLQDLKMALDDMLRDPASGIVGKEAAQAKNLRGQIVGWMEKANPEFGEARQTYAAMSKPINEMQVGQDLLNKLQPALSDFGASGLETGATFARQLRNSDKLAQNATGFKGAGTLEKVMSPENMKLLEAIGQDLALKSNGQNLGRAVGSPTMQNMMGQNLLNRVGSQLGLPQSFSESVIANTLARPYDFVMRSAEPKISGLLAEAMTSPAKASALLNLVQKRPGLLSEPELGLLSKAASRSLPLLSAD